MKHEPSIPGSRFALRARQGVFLARLRMQKHRKVLSDGLKAGLNQLLGSGANNDPVAISALDTK